VLVAGDVITLRIALGGLLILGAMYLVELGPRHNSEVADDLSKPHLGF